MTPCEYARQRHQKFLWVLLFWTGLLGIFGIFVVGFLVAAVTLLVRQDWVPGAVTFVGTVAEGAGMGWIYARRRTAVEEEKKAYEDVKKQCKATPDITGADADLLARAIQEAGALRLVAGIRK